MNSRIDQILCAIQNISNFSNVKDNLEIISNIVKFAENGDLDIDELKSKFCKANYSNNSVIELFSLLLLEHDKTKTLYLIKGLEVIMSDTSLKDMSAYKKETVNNLRRTVEDNGVNGAFIKILHKANKFYRYKSIIQ